MGKTLFGSVLYIVGEYGSGKTHLTNSLTHQQSLTNLTLAALKSKDFIVCHNVVLEADAFTAIALKHLDDMIKTLVASGHRVFVNCTPDMYKKIKKLEQR